MNNSTKPKTVVLIVEDDQVTMELTTKILTQEGYHIQAATDGEQCLDMVQKARPDLILMDVGLPVKNGLETCRHLRADPEFQKTPVIFMTANTDDKTLAAAYQAGGNDYVRKPMSRVELVSRVQNALAQQFAIEQLAEEQKLKTVLETAGGVCHKLNQPLQFVLGSLQILMMDMEPQDPKMKELKAILDRVEQMGGITRKLSEITHYRTRDYAGGQNILDIDECLK
jgi:sigma-B regulation protein RsbU (phosphoserine phosphatase)